MVLPLAVAALAALCSVAPGTAIAAPGLAVSGTTVYVTGLADDVRAVRSDLSYTSIRVGSCPNAVATADGKIYVSNYCSCTITVIRASDNAVIGTIPLDASPLGIVVSGKKLYVAEPAAGKVQVVSTASAAITGTIFLPQRSVPQQTAASEDGRYVCITDSNLGVVYILSVEVDKLIATIPIGGNVWGIATNGRRAYATASDVPLQLWGGLPSAARVTNVLVQIELSGAKSRITRIIPVDHPAGVAITADGTQACVANDRGATISVIDLSKKNAVTRKLPLPGGANPAWLAFSPDGGALFVTTTYAHLFRMTADAVIPVY